MALNVSYVNRIGYYTKTEKWKDEPERKFKNWMCHANVDLWADMYFYKAKEDYDDFGTKVKKGDNRNVRINYCGRLPKDTTIIPYEDYKKSYDVL